MDDKSYVSLEQRLCLVCGAPFDTGNLLLEQGRRTYKLPVSGAEWFQNFSEFPDETPVTWSGDFLQDVLDRVVFCISDDDATDAITCLYMKPCGNGRIDVCGLNGHQFALVQPDIDAKRAQIALLKALNRIGLGGQ